MRIWVVAVAMVCAESSPKTAREWNNLGAEAQAAGNLQEAEKMFRAAAMVATLDADRASISFNLAALERLFGRYSEAKQDYREAITIRERLFGRRDSSLAGPLAGLALTMVATGNLEAADECARRAVENGPAVVMAEHALAQVLTAERSFREAEKWALAASEGAPVNSVARAEIYSTLAAINRQQGRAAKAEAYATRATKILEQTLGAGHVATAAAWNNLAQAKLARGKSKEAVVLLSKSLAILQAAYGDSHLQVGMVEGNLAFAFAQRREWALSEPLFRKAIAVGSADDAELGALLENYSVVLRNLENFSEAAQIDARATGIRVGRAMKADYK